jgi:N-acetylneuraminic acid mutarotase
MYTIGNNNSPMSVKLNNEIWTLGQFNQESGYNSFEKWSIFDIPTEKISYIEIPKNIELGNVINMILKSCCNENIIYVAAGPKLKWGDTPSENEAIASNNPILYSYDTNKNSWLALKTFSPSIILYSILEKVTGEIILIGRCKGDKWVIFSSLQNYLEINLRELDGRFGYSFFLDGNSELWVYGGLDPQINYNNVFLKINTFTGEISNKKNVSAFDFRSFPLIVFNNECLYIIGGTKDGYYPASEIIKYDLNNNILKSTEDIQNITNNYFVNYCIAEDKNTIFVISGYIYNDKKRCYQFKEHKINKIHFN